MDVDQIEKNVPDNCVYAGNPAHYACSLDEYLEKQKLSIKNKNAPIFERRYRIEKNMSEDMKKEMIEKLKKWDWIFKIRFLILLFLLHYS